MPSIVALDIETTGLDKVHDAIIEIGAVRFNDRRVEDEFHTLLNPRRTIPPEITQLTGITNDMVRRAPTLQEVRDDLEAFVGDSPVLGHNVGFDMGFLQQRGLLGLNETMDTYALATVLLPTASRYNLGSLGQQLNIPFPATHRALDDARVTHQIFVQFLEKIRGLPLDLLAEITRVGDHMDWGGDLIFRQVMRERARETTGARRVADGGDLGPLFRPILQTGRAPRAEQRPTPLVPDPEPFTPLDPDMVAAILEYGGEFSRHFPHFEHRAEQVEMLRNVVWALSEQKHLFVEAGTGTGKCLTGDALVTFKSGKRVRMDTLCLNSSLPDEPVLSVSSTGKLIYQKIIGVHQNGIRPVWRMQTGLGKVITATHNHPFLTVEGWKHLGELKTGDRIATLRKLPVGTETIAGHEAFVVGAMLGDGSCIRPDALHFTNIDSEIVATFEEAVSKLGNVRMTKVQGKGQYGFRRLSLMNHERSGLNLLLERMDVLGRDARSKHIPICFFEANEEALCHLLAGLWVTDGCVEKRDGNLSFSSISEQMVAEIQHLLLKLNIVSRKRYKQLKFRGEDYDAWELVISDQINKQKFKETVGKYLVGQKRIRLEKWWQENETRPYNPNDDLIPSGAWELINDARIAANKSWYAIRNFSIVSSDRTREISRTKMSRIGEFLEAPELLEMGTSDLYWDRVTSIEAAGEVETFDLTMEGEPNFVANDIVVHNSVAYLVPASLWALQNNTRVVVSTNTINLQDQLVSKDIPDIIQALDVPLRAAVLKGRSNYLCPRRFETLRRQGADSADEVRLIAKMLIWLSEGGGGDRQEINLHAGERMVWERVSAADDACTNDACQRRAGGTCPFYRARQAAQNAHIVIVNHALLLADVATGNRVLPEYQYLIVDEAHHMESAVTSALSFRISQVEVERTMRELGSTSGGILGRLLTTLHDVIQPSQYASMYALAEQATTSAIYFQNSSRNFFVEIDNFLSAMREGRDVGPYSQQVRILPATRTQPAWIEVESLWDEAQASLRSLRTYLEQMAKGMVELMEGGFEGAEDAYGDLSNLYRRLSEVDVQMDALVFKPDANQVYWVETQADGRRMSLNAAPLHIGPLMQEHVWHQKSSVILTSATLTTHGEFKYIQGRLFGQDADTIQVGSPFDYERSTLLYIPNNIPEPTDRWGHQRAVEQGLIQLCKASGGRALALFTSYDQLKRTAQAISGPLAEHGIMVYEQGTGASATALLENFKSAEQAILLGTRSFWEGVDIPGEALSVLAIIKLPFDVPSDPIIAARSETFENAFQEYTLPEAILRFRQGFGRLIRTKFDRGVVVIFDKRVLTKSYGKLFVESLPQCTVRVAPVANLPQMAGQWLNL